MRKYLSIFIERSVLVGAALLALAASANAQYGIAAEINDSGGGASANAAYTNNGNIGTIGGTATASSPVEFVKSGFVGELYNVAGLQVTGDGNERGRRARVSTGSDGADGRRFLFAGEIRAP